VFDTLQNKLLKVITSSGGRGRLKPDDLKSVLSELRMTLLEADVHFQVAQNFCDQLQSSLEKQKILETLTPDQTILKCAQDELTHILGDEPTEFTLKPPSKEPSVVLLTGLYGVGKTTQAVKLAKFVENNLDRKTLLVSCDATRPAAHEQLFQFAKEHNISAVPPPEKESFDSIKRIKEAKKQAKKEGYSVLIVDTAGRSTLDQDLLGEIKRLINKIKPEHILLVLDAMLGQSSIQVAKTFHENCPLTGNILTKCDGDARGGVALSARLITRRPIFFMGLGERAEDIEVFNPKRMASRILDLGDMESLFEKAEATEKPQNADALIKAMKSGSFHLGDFKEQLQMMQGLGPIGGLLKMIPGMGKMMQGVGTSQLEDAQKSVKKFRAIIDSMTQTERENPRVLNGSRRKRISDGSGTTPQDVNTLLRQFDQMKKMMKHQNLFKMLKP
jgi:signal recognition particle subunit SRP54